MRNRALLGVVLATAWPATTRAQFPAGAEFQVNSFVDGDQMAPAVARWANGDFVAVWMTNTPRRWDTDGLGIFGRRFNAAGTPVGSEFQVNAYTPGYQVFPAVASVPDGSFVVVWASGAQDGSSGGVFGRRFNMLGVPLGPEFRVNSYTTGPQIFPALATDANGNFVVVWTDYGQGEVSGQRYSAAGAPQGGEFQINTYTPLQQSDPAVSFSEDGTFTVVWRSAGQGGPVAGIFGRRFDSFGSPLPGEFHVNSHMTGDNRRPVLAANADGQFTVVWATGATDGDSLGIAGRRFGAGGLPEGEEFLVNSYTTGLQSLPAIASDEHGNVLVVWASENQDGSGFGVFGQAFDATGAPLGHEFRVNSYTSGNQGQGGTWWTRLAMTSHSDANFLVVWESGHDGNGSGLFGQRYDDILFRDGFDPIAPSPPPLALLAPPDGSVFSNYPRSLRLQWTPVADPPGLRYYVEMESWSGGWWGLSQGSGYYGNCVGLLATTTCTTLTFPGAQPGRWRVSAYDAAGWRVLGPTPWSRFLFVY